MTQPNRPGDRTADAIECFLCLADPDAEPSARARWTAWLGESDENRAAYHRARDTWSRPVPGDVWPSHDEIVNDGYDASAPIPARPTAFQGRSGRRAGARTVRGWPASAWLTPIAGGLLVAVILVGWQKMRPASQTPPQAQVYQTARGEQRRIALADGSAITLGPLSGLTLTAGEQGRTARLDSGEALFAINHDPLRPFKLSTNGGEIEDVGTTFAVEIRSDRATVTVVDGTVKVSPRAEAASVALTHDEQVSFSRELGPVATVDGHSETDWSRGRLAYVDQSLADVVADLERYTTRDIVLADGNVGAIRYTGTIESDAIDQWAAALTHVFPVTAKREGNRLVLRSTGKK
jgi:transmembrane sensor